MFDSPFPFMWVLWLIAFSHRSAALRQRMATGPLGSRACSFYACVGSTTPQSLRCARVYRAPPCCLPDCVTPSALWIRYFGAHQLQGYQACICPCPTLPVQPHGCPHLARGQSGSLLLSLYDSFIHYFTPVYPDAIHAGVRAQEWDAGVRAPRLIRNGNSKREGLARSLPGSRAAGTRSSALPGACHSNCGTGGSSSPDRAACRRTDPGLNPGSVGCGG